MKTKSFGIEVEYPMWDSGGGYTAWVDEFNILSKKLPGKLYRDATPCGEYATSVHTDYNALLDELFSCIFIIVFYFPHLIQYKLGHQ